MFDRLNTTVLTTALFTFVLGTLMLYALMRQGEKTSYHEEVIAACEGQPITVDYEFLGGYIEDHACAAQCGDNVRRYVLYSNGLATQCEALPGCNDWGEDNGVTCTPNT